MMINYLNGRYLSADQFCPKGIRQGNGFVCDATNEGFPFRGTPTDMANDALSHLGVYSEFYPVILSTEEGSDNMGRYTTSVTFEAVKNLF